MSSRPTLFWQSQGKKTVNQLSHTKVVNRERKMCTGLKRTLAKVVIRKGRIVQKVRRRRSWVMTSTQAVAVSRQWHVPYAVFQLPQPTLRSTRNAVPAFRNLSPPPLLQNLLKTPDPSCRSWSTPCSKILSWGRNARRQGWTGRGTRPRWPRGTRGFHSCTTSSGRQRGLDQMQC